MTDAATLPEWQDYIATLGEAEGVLALLADPADPRSRQQAHRLLFLSLASGFLSAFADPDTPDFVPLVNNVFNSIGVNPDFIYSYARIDGSGSYRLSGFRGDGLFLLFDFAAGGLGVMDDLGPSVGVLDADTLTLGANGSFDVLLSKHRPPDHAVDWFALDPRATTIGVREASYDWGAGRDAKLAIERIDPPRTPRLSNAGDIAHRLQKLAAYPARFGRFALGYDRGQRARGLVNRLEHDDWAGRGGVAGQHYYQGIFSLAPDEAMIVGDRTAGAGALLEHSIERPVLEHHRLVQPSKQPQRRRGGDRCRRPFSRSRFGRRSGRAKLARSCGSFGRFADAALDGSKFRPRTDAAHREAGRCPPPFAQSHWHSDARAARSGVACAAARRTIAPALVAAGSRRPARYRASEPAADRHAECARRVQFGPLQIGRAGRSPPTKLLVAASSRFRTQSPAYQRLLAAV